MLQYLAQIAEHWPQLFTRFQLTACIHYLYSNELGAISSPFVEVQQTCKFWELNIPYLNCIQYAHLNGCADTAPTCTCWPPGAV